MTDDTPRASDNGQATRTTRPPGRFLPWLRRTVPFVLVVAGLVGVALWGHRTDWTFNRTLRQIEQPTGGASELARVRVGAALPQRPDIPSALRREVVIDFDSADAVDAAGIGIAPAWPGAIAETVEAPGEVAFDPALLARVGPRAGGTVWRVTKKVGDPVAAGEVLALVDAAEAGRAKADFQQTFAQVRLREKTLAGRRAAADAVSAQSVREAEAAFAEAETRLLAASQALANLDLSANPADYRALPLDEVIVRMRLVGVPQGTGLDAKTATANLLPVRAPFAGVVLSADAVAGEVVELGRPIFVVADPSRVWVTLHVRASDAGRVAVGQQVRFHTDGSAEEVGGKVEWVGPAVDESTRTVLVRATLPNAAGRLRAGTLGQGRVVLRQETKAILVPHDAVQTFRGTAVVFVRHPEYLKPAGPKSYSVRPVQVGAKDADNTEIVAGLKGGEVVATKGSGLLLHELTRGIDEADAAR